MDPVSLVLVAMLVGAAIAAWKAWPIVSIVAIGLAVGIGMAWIAPAWLLVPPAIALALLAWSIIRYALATPRRRISPDTDTFEPRNETHHSTETIDAYFDRQTHALTAAGFHQHGDIVEVSRNEKTETLTFLRFFTKAETRVTITGIVLRAGTHVFEQPPSTNCTTRLADGKVIITNNAREPDPFSTPLNEDRVVLPSFADVGPMLDAHRVHVRNPGPPALEVELPVDWIAEIRAHRRRWVAHQVVSGLIRKISESEFRLTTRGMLRYTVFTHPFLAGVQKRIATARERDAIKRLGLTPSTMPKPTLLQRLRTWEMPALALFLVVGMCYSTSAEVEDGSFMTRGATIRIPSDLVVPDSFADAVRLLESLTGKRASTLLTHPDVEATGMDILAIPLSAPDAKLVVQQAQGKFAAKGFLVFHTTDHGDQYRVGQDAIAIAPYNDPYRVMRRVNTNGDNFRISTDSVIAWFRETERELPLRFTSISFDFVGAIWDGEVRDPTNFGKRFLAFCPELRDSARRAGQALARDHYLFCWWD